MRKTALILAEARQSLNGADRLMLEVLLDIREQLVEMNEYLNEDENEEGYTAKSKPPQAFEAEVIETGTLHYKVRAIDDGEVFQLPVPHGQSAPPLLTDNKPTVITVTPEMLVEADGG